jgi:hypothetical protein
MIVSHFLELVSDEKEVHELDNHSGAGSIAQRSGSAR